MNDGLIGPTPLPTLRFHDSLDKHYELAFVEQSFEKLLGPFQKLEYSFAEL